MAGYPCSGDEAIPEGSKWAEIPLLGGKKKRKENTMWERKSLMVRSTGISGQILWSIRISVLFSYDSPILDFSLYSPRISSLPPHLCTLFSLAYSGVPDAGRDGVWIPAQTNADRTSAATGKIWSIA